MELEERNQNIVFNLLLQWELASLREKKTMGRSSLTV